MTRISNTPVARPVSQASTDNRRSQSERSAALKTLDQASQGSPAEH